ncbi:MAG: hypothetical protein KAJ01_06625 [Candidatus Hydrogenedentes bacterium]|nr:hypothetical protein [Candidatus Hydrogenedentota bacterium]
MSKVPVRIVAAGDTVNLWKIYIGDQEVSHAVRRAELVLDPREKQPILTLQIAVNEVEIPQEALVTLRIDRMMMLWQLGDLMRWWIWRFGRLWSKVTARLQKKPKVRLAKKPVTTGTVGAPNQEE